MMLTCDLVVPGMQIWDAGRGDLVHSLGPHPDCVRSASFSPDIQNLCTGCDDGIVRVSLNYFFNLN